MIRVSRGSRLQSWIVAPTSAPFFLSLSAKLNQGALDRERVSGRLRECQDKCSEFRKQVQECSAKIRRMEVCVDGV